MRTLCTSLFVAMLMMRPVWVAVLAERHPSHPHGGPTGQVKKVVVVEGHICTASCDHIFIDGIWYREVGHRHGPGCGHYLVNGKWGKHKGDDHDDKDDKKDKTDKKDKKDKKDKDGN